MLTDAQQLKLERRIHNQRKRIAWFEGLFFDRNLSWKRKALAYRKQLEDNGIEPFGHWAATFKLPQDR